jgi:hypothetical protein
MHTSTGLDLDHVPFLGLLREVLYPVQPLGVEYDPGLLAQIIDVFR